MIIQKWIKWILVNTRILNIYKSMDISLCIIISSKNPNYLFIDNIRNINNFLS